MRRRVMTALTRISDNRSRKCLGQLSFPGRTNGLSRLPASLGAVSVEVRERPIQTATL